MENAVKVSKTALVAERLGNEVLKRKVKEGSVLNVKYREVIRKLDTEVTSLKTEIKNLRMQQKEWAFHPPAVEELRTAVKEEILQKFNPLFEQVLMEEKSKPVFQHKEDRNRFYIQKAKIALARFDCSFPIFKAVYKETPSVLKEFWRVAEEFERRRKVQKVVPIITALDLKKWSVKNGQAFPEAKELEGLQRMVAEFGGLLNQTTAIPSELEVQQIEC